MSNRIYTVIVVVLTGLIVSTSILLVSLWIAGSAKNPLSQITSEPVATPLISQEKLWSLVQQWRAGSNRTQYKESAYTCSLADVRVKQIQTNYSHEGLAELVQTPKFKPTPGNSAQENIAAGNSSEIYEINAWLNSPDHRETLEKPYPYSCLRCENNFCVQVFATY